MYLPMFGYTKRIKINKYLNTSCICVIQERNDVIFARKDFKTYKKKIGHIQYVFFMCATIKLTSS